MPRGIRDDAWTQHEVDFLHDHSCCDGENTCGNCVRGIVHSQCNCGLGFFNDDLTKLRKAVKYLEKYAGVTN